MSCIAALPCEAAPTYRATPGIQTQAGARPNIYKEDNVQTVRVGQTVVVWVDAAVDSDTWTDGNTRGAEDDQVTYKWTAGAGRFTSATNERFATWEAPNRQNTYTISCVINDPIRRPISGRGAHPRDDKLIELPTRVRVVSGAPIWLESDIERSYQYNTSSGRRVKMPDGALQVKTVHSVASLNTGTNRWRAANELVGRVIVGRRSDGTTSGEWLWSVNGSPAEGGGLNNRIALRNQELRHG